MCVYKLEQNIYIFSSVLQILFVQKKHYLSFICNMLFSQCLTQQEELYSYSFTKFVQLCKVITEEALQPIERHGYISARFSEADSCKKYIR